MPSRVPNTLASGRVRIAASVLASVCLVTAVIAPTAGTRGLRAQEQDAAAVFTRVCGNCHTPDRIVGTRRSRDQWEQVVEGMKAKGARVPDDDFGTIVDYLVGRYGRVNVNTAAAGGIVEVLHISAADADRIVSYRRAHGRFEDFGALAKVPGLDASKLESARDAISF